MKKCSSCSQEIHMLRSTSTDRWMPVDDQISLDGNVRVDLDARTAEVLSGERLAAAREAGESLSLSHFVTCPKAASHRRRT